MWKFVAVALALVSQPACAAVLFQGASLSYSTYSEAGGTGKDGGFASNVRDLSGQAASATLPGAPLHKEVLASSSYTDKAGTLLARASATASGNATFQSASDVSVAFSGQSSATVTKAGGLDPLIFAGASPMNASRFFYDFVVDGPTELVFGYASSDALDQGQFALGGTMSEFAFLSGSGTLSYILPAGSYALSVLDYGSGSSVTTMVGSVEYAFTRDYTLKLRPSAAAVPEIGTWLMLLFGIGMAGNALRHQQKRRSLA